MRLYTSARNFFESVVKTDSIVAKTFLETFWVVLLAECVNVMSKLIDGIMVSTLLGPEAIAAYSMTSPFFGMVGVFSGVIALGTQSKIASKIGKGEMKGIEKQLSSSLLFSLIPCGLLIPCGYFFVSEIAVGLGASGNAAYLAPFVEDYLLGIIPSMLPFIWNAILIPAIQINGDKKRVTISVIASLGANCIGNLLFMTVLDMGILGISISTSLAQFLLMVILLLHFRKKDCICRLSLKYFSSPEILDSLRIGMPKAIRRACKTILPLFLNRWIIFLGTGAAMSAFAVQNSLRDSVLLISAAVASTVRMITGIYYGEEDRTEIKKLFRTSFFFSTVSSVAIGTVLFLLSPIISSIYIPDNPEVEALTVSCMRWFSLSIPFATFNEFYLDFLQGTSRIKTVHIFTFFEKLLYIGGCAFILGIIFGIKGVFASLMVSEALLSVSIAVWAAIKNGKIPRRVSDLVVLPDDFGYDISNSEEYIVRSSEDAIKLPIHVDEFCRKHNFDQKRRLYAAICLDEMVNRTVNKGFNDGKDHSLYMRLIKKDNDLIMRIKDDCALFNIVNEDKNEKETDKFSNVGIRIVIKMSKEVLYANSLNTNTVIIRI